MFLSVAMLLIDAWRESQRRASPFALEPYPERGFLKSAMNAAVRATCSSRDSRLAFRELDVGDADHLRPALLGCVACLYLPFIFAGPGSDPDSIRELHSGTTLLWQHRYVLSRPPGYFPYEALCGVLYCLGGSVGEQLRD